MGAETVRQHCSAWSCSSALCCSRNRPGKCIALESRNSHVRKSLLWVENGGEGFTVCYEREPSPIKGHMEPFNTLRNRQLFLVDLYVLALCLGLALCLSLLSGITSERTAPMPVGEASHASVSGYAWSWCVTTCSEVIMCLASVKACSHCSVHCHSLSCSSSCCGEWRTMDALYRKRL